jgi:hypothetical protein
MKKPEWPGIATAVGIALILTLVIVGGREDFHLKEWQTLATGFLALLAAGAAYLGRDRERAASNRRPRTRDEPQETGSLFED